MSHKLSTSKKKLLLKALGSNCPNNQQCTKWSQNRDNWIHNTPWQLLLLKWELEYWYQRMNIFVKKGFKVYDESVWLSYHHGTFINDLHTSKGQLSSAKIWNASDQYGNQTYVLAFFSTIKCPMWVDLHFIYCDFLKCCGKLCFSFGYNDT